MDRGCPLLFRDNREVVIFSEVTVGRFLEEKVKMVVAHKFSYASEPDDSLKCLICMEVAEEPWQHDKCGRLFCDKCLDRHGKFKPCPNCRADQPQYFVDNRGK